MAKRGKVPSLLSGSNGKPRKTVADRSRTCKRCGASIGAGSTLYEIPKTTSGFSNKESVCLTCFDEIIRQTQMDLDLLRDELQTELSYLKGDN